VEIVKDIPRSKRICGSPASNEGRVARNVDQSLGSTENQSVCDWRTMTIFGIW
jgi:hypothetical protein